MRALAFVFACSLFLFLLANPALGQTCAVGKLPTYIEVTTVSNENVGTLEAKATLYYVDDFRKTTGVLPYQDVYFQKCPSGCPPGSKICDLGCCDNAGGRYCGPSTLRFCLPSEWMCDRGCCFADASTIKGRTDSNGEAFAVFPKDNISVVAMYKGGDRYFPSNSSGTYGSSPLGNITLGACFPLFLLLGLLLVAMGAAGYNPLGMFDFSAVRVPRARIRPLISFQMSSRAITASLALGAKRNLEKASVDLQMLKDLKAKLGNETDPGKKKELQNKIDGLESKYGKQDAKKIADSEKKLKDVARELQEEKKKGKNADPGKIASLKKELDDEKRSLHLEKGKTGRSVEETIEHLKKQVRFFENLTSPQPVKMGKVVDVITGAPVAGMAIRAIGKALKGKKHEEKKTEEGGETQEKMVQRVKTVKDVTVLGKASGTVWKGAKFVAKMTLWSFKAPFAGIKKFGEWWDEFAKSKAGRGIFSFLGIVTFGMAGRKDYGTNISIGPVTFYAGSPGYIETVYGWMDARALLMQQNKKVVKQIGDALEIDGDVVWVTIASGYFSIGGAGARRDDVLREEHRIHKDKDGNVVEKLVSSKATEGSGENVKDVVLYKDMRKDKDNNVYVNGVYVREADGTISEVELNEKGEPILDSEGKFKRVGKPLVIYETGKKHGLVLLEPTGVIEAYQGKEGNTSFARALIRKVVGVLGFADAVAGAFVPLRYGMMSRRIYDTSTGTAEIGVAEPEDKIVFMALDAIERSRTAAERYKEDVMDLAKHSSMQDEIRRILDDKTLAPNEKFEALSTLLKRAYEKKAPPEDRGKTILRKIFTGEGSKQEDEEEDVKILTKILTRYRWMMEAESSASMGQDHLEMINAMSVRRARLQKGDREIDEAKEKLADASKSFGLSVPEAWEVLYDNLGEHRKKITEKSEALKKDATAKESKKLDEKTKEIMQKLDEYVNTVRRNYADNEFQAGVALGLIYVTSKRIDEIDKKIKKEDDEDNKNALRNEREQWDNLQDFVYEFKPSGERTASISALLKSVVEGKDGRDKLTAKRDDLTAEVEKYKKEVYSVEDAYYGVARVDAIRTAKEGGIEKIDELRETSAKTGNENESKLLRTLEIDGLRKKAVDTGNLKENELKLLTKLGIEELDERRRAARDAGTPSELVLLTESEISDLRGLAVSKERLEEDKLKLLTESEGRLEKELLNPRLPESVPRRDVEEYVLLSENKMGEACNTFKETFGIEPTPENVNAMYEELANQPSMEQILAMRAYPQIKGAMDETRSMLTEGLDKAGYFDEFKKNPGLLSENDGYRYEESKDKYKEEEAENQHFDGIFNPEEPGALFYNAIELLEQEEMDPEKKRELVEKLRKKKEKVEQITLSSPLMLSYGMFSSLKASLDGGRREPEPMKTKPIHEELILRKMEEDMARYRDAQWGITKKWIDEYEVKRGLLRGLPMFESYLGS